MNITFDIPDDLARRINAKGELSRLALEALAIEEYRKARITLAELRRLLGFSSRPELDRFLKDHAVYSNYTMQDFESEQQDLQRIGF